MTIDETFNERIERLRSLRSLKLGDRIEVIGTGRTGEIVGLHVRHVGFKIRWDEPMFGVVESRVRAHLIRKEES